MTSTIVCDELPLLYHPLGPINKLVLAPGIVTGTKASSSARISVGRKLAPTGGIKESNSSTRWSHNLAAMQIRMLVVEDQPKEKGK
jgi:aldehyde:ferredoxin oxidoreductase